MNLYFMSVFAGHAIVGGLFKSILTDIINYSVYHLRKKPG